MVRKLIVFFAPFLFFLFASCSSQVVVREINVTHPEVRWASVLKTYVDSKGRIDFVGLSHNLSDLEAYVSYVGKVSPKTDPTLFPDADSRLAYYLNAYNALAMYNVVHFDIPENNGSFFRKFKFFYLTKYKVGGEFMSLYALEGVLIRPLGDPRVHIALNCMVRGCPRLPQEPFIANKLQRQLEAQAHEFYNEPRNVQTDHKKKEVGYSEILKFFTEDFLKKAPTLTAYVNQYRNEKVPDDYKVEFIPYDWTVNIHPPKPAEPKKITGRTESGRTNGRL